jgi:thiol-disulfide isomerase/thioredoxin
MKKIRNNIIAAVLGLIVLTWGIKWYIHKNYPPKMIEDTVLFTNADDGSAFSLVDYKGKVLIVSCFQTWCGACAGETPVLNKLAANIHSDAFKVIYITDEQKEKVMSFREKFSSDHILFAYSQKKLTSLGIHVYPTTFLLNKKGEVVKTSLEGYDWLLEEKRIQKMLAE